MLPQAPLDCCQAPLDCCRQIRAIVSQLEVVIMPWSGGAWTKEQLMQKMLSKWGADEDDNAAKVLKRPSAKRPASAMEEQGAEGENATKVLKRPEIINAIFKNNSDGSWNVNLDHPIAQEIACREVIASCKKAKKKGEGVWNALLECPKTKTVQSVRANLRKGLTDIQTQLTLFEDMLAALPLIQDKIEADFMHAALSLENLLELVDVAKSYIQWYDDQ